MISREELQRHIEDAAYSAVSANHFHEMLSSLLDGVGWLNPDEVQPSPDEWYIAASSWWEQDFLTLEWRVTQAIQRGYPGTKLEDFGEKVTHWMPIPPPPLPPPPSGEALCGCPYHECPNLCTKFRHLGICNKCAVTLCSGERGATQYANAHDSGCRADCSIASHMPQPDAMNGHDESESCWCGPRVEEHDGARLIIHNRAT